MYMYIKKNLHVYLYIDISIIYLLVYSWDLFVLFVFLCTYVFLKLYQCMLSAEIKLYKSLNKLDHYWIEF